MNQPHKPNSQTEAVPEALLLVHHEGDRLGYVWRTARRELGGERKLEADLVSTLAAIKGHFARLRSSVSERIAGIGRHLAEELLTPEISSALEGLVRRSPVRGGAEVTGDGKIPSLWVVSNEGSIPWELLRPGASELTLGEALRVTRWFFDRECPRTFGFSPFARIQASSPGLEHAVKEVRALQRLAEEFGWTERPIRAKTGRILEELRDNPPAALHVVAHGGRDETSPLLSHLLLGEGETAEKLAVSDLKGLDFRGPAPFVYLNACESAGATQGFSGVGSFATQFVSEGAAVFVGTQWKVADEIAPELPETLYRSLAGGASLGEGSRKARAEVWTRSSDDATPLAYAAFGHPDARLDSGLSPAPAVRWPGRYLEVPRYEYEPASSPPGALLRADHGIVPFHLRNEELDDLRHWAEEDRALAIRLYTGPGGQGKTRLALHLCSLLRNEGWRAGFVKSSADANVKEALDEIFAGGGPVLAVVDYAETRRGLLAPLVQRVHEKRNDGPFRVILLARRREEWWEQLKREKEPVGGVFAGPATRHYTLQPLATGLDQRIETFELAARSFAEELNEPKKETPKLDLEARYFDPVLMIHMAALGTVQGVDLKDEDGILDNTLDRERRFWETQLEARGLPRNLRAGVGRALCAITLAGGVRSRAEAIDYMEGLKFFDGQPRAVMENIAGLLHTVYPGERWIEAVQPDILGEHLIERELEEDAQEVFDLVLGPRKQL